MNKNRDRIEAGMNYLCLGDPSAVYHEIVDSTGLGGINLDGELVIRSNAMNGSNMNIPYRSLARPSS